MTTNIPKIIIQTWKNVCIPSIYKDNINKIKILNKDYEYLFFTDDSIDNFFINNYMDYFETYCKLPTKIQKIDFFKYVVIYHYGGIYLDIDYKPFSVSFDDLLEYKCIFPVDTNITDENKNNCRYSIFNENNIKFLLGNYAFGAEKNNNFIKYIIDNICVNVDDYLKKYETNNNNNKINTNTNNENYIYTTTGKDFITNNYINYIMFYNEKNNIKILFNKNNQYFGKYGVNDCYGSWKKYTLIEKVFRNIKIGVIKHKQKQEKIHNTNNTNNI